MQETVRKKVGRPFVKGIGGNPRGRPKLTAEELDLIQACRKLTPQALERIRGLMDDADKDSVKFNAAAYIIDRGWGKAPNVVEINATVTQLSHEERLARIAELQAKLTK